MRDKDEDMKTLKEGLKDGWSTHDSRQMKRTGEEGSLQFNHHIFSLEKGYNLHKPTEGHA